jgi:hypothetical protein
MNKSEFTSSSAFSKSLMSIVILAAFLCSLNAGVYWSTAKGDSESLAIHSVVASIRNYALTNLPTPRTESNLARPKPVKQHAQPGALPEKVSELNGTKHRPPFDGEILLNKFSACCCQSQGRAPPLFA